jgi:hypothetical protein
MIPNPHHSRTLRVVYQLPGNAGIYQTLWTIAQMAHKAGGSLRFRNLVLSICRTNAPVGNVVKCLFEYCFSKIRFVDDPDTMEYLIEPDTMLDEIQKQGFTTGDCDDHVILMSSLLTAARIPNSAVALAIPDMGPDYNHAVNMVDLGDGQSILLDCSQKERINDYQYTHSIRAQVYP